MLELVLLFIIALDVCSYLNYFIVMQMHMLWDLVVMVQER